MALVAGGREKAFDELYGRYAARMLAFFYRKLDRDAQKAQDFLQDLFLKIAEKPGYFDISKSFVVWIYTVAYNMCKNEYRKMAVRGGGTARTDVSELANLPDLSAAKVSEKLDRDFFADSLHKALEGLDEKHQTAFILRYNDNLSIRQISLVLECAEGTVKSRLFYALKKLSSELTVFDPHREEK
jgi:RNA polymerase sigma-70 factor (ECF subfamily)